MENFSESKELFVGDKLSEVFSLQETYELSHGNEWYKFYIASRFSAPASGEPLLLQVLLITL